MECKNCSTPQRTDFNYCPNCGAKVIRNRLTIRNLWYDVTERYFNLDNTFIKTFLHLFSRPQLVIDGYIKGVRRRYLNPMSYFGISIALSGLLFFILRRYFIDKINVDIFNMGIDPDASEKIMSATLDFSSFIFILYIPVIAVASWLTFNRKKYILPEYVVSAIYTLAHYSISIFPISLIILIIVPEKYVAISPFFLSIMVLYALYVVHRLNSCSLIQGFGRSFIFIAIYFVGYVGVSLLLTILLLAIGDISIQDYLPKNI